MTIRTPWWSGISQLPAPTDRSDVLQDWAERRLLQLSTESGVSMFKGYTGGSVKDLKMIMDNIATYMPAGAKMVYGKLATKEKFPPNQFWAWEDGAMDVSIHPGEKADGHIHVWMMCPEQERIQTIIDMIANNLVPLRQRSMGRVYVIGRGMMGYDFYSLGVASVPIERDNYTDDVLKAYDEAVIDLNTIAPKGRLTVFDGPPGTGKTFLVRALIDAIKDAVFVFVPPGIVDFLASPELIPMLIQKKSSNYIDGPIVFILEDADNILVPRAKDNMSLISTLLNMTSGILGSMLDIRAVATTNSPKADIDPALLRPGRLSSHMTVTKLDASKANQIFKRLTGKARLTKTNSEPFTKEASLADVYLLARENGWEPPKNSERAQRRAALASYEGTVVAGNLSEAIAMYPGKERSFL